MRNMSSKNLLDEMEAIERDAAVLYDRLSERFAPEYPAAGSLFYMLAVEERSHARAIAQFDRILWANPFLAGLRVLDKHDGNAARDLLAMAAGCADTLCLEDALAFAWLFEVKMGESYWLVCQAEANPSLKRLLAVLRDAGHIERLCEFAGEWGLLSHLPERACALERRLAPGAVAAS